MKSGEYPWMNKTVKKSHALPAGADTSWEPSAEQVDDGKPPVDEAGGLKDGVSGVGNGGVVSKSVRPPIFSIFCFRPGPYGILILMPDVNRPEKTGRQKFSCNGSEP